MPSVKCDLSQPCGLRIVGDDVFKVLRYVWDVVGLTTNVAVVKNGVAIWPSGKDACVPHQSIWV